MAYEPNPIDFLDTVQLDISVSPDVATKLDAMSPEEQAGMVEALCHDCGENPCDGDIHARLGPEWVDEYDALDDSRIELFVALSGLLDAFPRLASDYATAEQQTAYRAARKAVGR